MHRYRRGLKAEISLSAETESMAESDVRHSDETEYTPKVVRSTSMPLIP